MNELYKIFLNSQQNLLQVLSNKNKLGISGYKERMLLKELNEIITEMIEKSWNFGHAVRTGVEGSASDSLFASKELGIKTPTFNKYHGMN